jgi:hypothetical protein
VVKFIDVDPEEVPNLREARRGRVSYPILKSFMETGKTLVILDRTGIQQSMMSLTSSLGAYIRNHNLPIKIFQRGGQLYLMRTDTNETGDAEAINLDRYQPPPEEEAHLNDDGDIPFVDAKEVAGRFKTERPKTTK